MFNVCKLKCSGNMDRWTVSWIRLEMWRLGNWISCRKELDFIKSQYQEHASACNGFLTLKEHFWRWNLKSEALSQMSVNWVRFPCCSAGPTSAALISSNISQNHSTPFSTVVHCTFARWKLYPRKVPNTVYNSKVRSANHISHFSNWAHQCACGQAAQCGSQAEGSRRESTKLRIHNSSFPTSLSSATLPAGAPIAGGSPQPVGAVGAGD